MAWADDIRVRFPDWGTDAALARWPTVKARLTVGQTVRGEVIARAPFGVWVDIRAGHPALLLVPDMAGACERPIQFEEYPAMGAVVEAHIVTLGDRAEIRLTQNPSWAVVMETPAPGFRLGQKVRVRLNQRNRTPHEGTIRAIVWHHKDRRYNYYLQEGYVRFPSAISRRISMRWSKRRTGAC